MNLQKATMKFCVLVCSCLSLLVYNVKSKETKDLNTDMQALKRKINFSGNKTDSLEVQILELLEPELNSDKVLDFDKHQTNSYNKRHVKRKRKCKKGRKGKKCSLKSKKKKSKKTLSKKRCTRSENRCWRKISDKCINSPSCAKKFNNKCHRKYNKCLSKVKKLQNHITVTTTKTLKTKHPFYQLGFSNNQEVTRHPNQPRPQRPDNEPIKKLNGYMEDCKTDSDCFDGMCCTYHGSYRRVCKHLIKKDKICTKQFTRHKRVPMQDYYAQCPCEVGLKCKGTQEDMYWFCRA